ncbi:MAG: MBL fold metallo-hydrolase [Clostridia bacterium]|nr:MBL fold metallo-hydrolase [Clostridia bacterium]
MALSDIAPFRMAGNLYFVGTYKASSHLLVTNAGHILIDTGYEDNLETIVDSVTELGFDIKDIKYILHSHGHYDHTDATAKLVELTGAKTFLAKEDVKYIKGFTPDVYYTDGMVVSLGGTDVRCLHTPGHTEGTYSLFFDVEENGKKLRCGMFGGASAKQLRKSWLKKWDIPYSLRASFLDSVEKLKKEHVDLFVGNHSWQNHTRENAELLKANPTVNPFVDESGEIWQAFLRDCNKKFASHMWEDSRETFVTYAHRGASEYAPENTMLSFYTGVFMGANGIETDVRKTRDGVLVLHHDATPARMCGEEHTRRIDEMTWAELQALNVQKGELSDKIVAFEDFLAHFAHRDDITFAIELKQADIEVEVAALLRRYNMYKKTFVTSFRLDYIQRIKEIAPELRVGWLVKEVTDGTLDALRAIGADELCPPAALVTPERVSEWHAAGFNVRAWGVNRDNMKAVYDAGADGMTVNFPDELLAYMKQTGEARH